MHQTVVYTHVVAKSVPASICLNTSGFTEVVTGVPIVKPEWILASGNVATGRSRIFWICLAAAGCQASGAVYVS